MKAALPSFFLHRSSGGPSKDPALSTCYKTSGLARFGGRSAPLSFPPLRHRLYGQLRPDSDPYGLTNTLRERSSIRLRHGDVRAFECDDQHNAQAFENDRTRRSIRRTVDIALL